MTDDTKQPTSIEKLSALMEKLLDERTIKLCAVDEARTILREEPPTAFDSETAARAIAQARVADLMNDGSSADAIAEEFEKTRLATDKATILYEQRQVKARKQFEDASRLVQALTTQAEEIDAAIRREFAAASQEWEADAEQVLAESAAKFVTDYINAQAMACIRFTEIPGAGRKQFAFPGQMDMTLSIPESVLSVLPTGHKQGAIRSSVVYDRYEVERLVNARVIQIMGEQSSWLYPKIGAGLKIETGCPETS